MSKRQFALALPLPLANSLRGRSSELFQTRVAVGMSMSNGTSMGSTGGQSHLCDGGHLHGDVHHVQPLRLGGGAHGGKVVVQPAGVVVLNPLVIAAAAAAVVRPNTRAGE